MDCRESARRADLRVVRVRRRETIAEPRVVALIERAVEKAGVGCMRPAGVYEQLTADVASDALGVFVGFVGEEPQAIAVAMLPTAMMAGPQVALAYSEDRDLARMIGERIAAWVRAAGYDHYYAVNARHRDDSWSRVFAHAGVISPAGTIFEVRV